MRRWLMLCSVLLALAACGGGGGGSSSGTPAAILAGSGAANAAVTATPLSGNTALQRALVQQSLTSTSQAPAIAGYAGGSSSSNVTLGMMRKAFSTARSAQAVTTTLCSAGQTTSSSPGAGNAINFTLNQFYDTSCTKLWYTGTYVATETTTQISLTGSIVYYTTAGVVYEYANPASITLTVSGSTTYVSLGSTIAVNQTSPPLGSFGLGCSIATSSTSCSIGAVAHASALGLDNGASAVATAAGSTTAAGTTVTISGSGSSYAGALNTLSLTSSGTGTYLWNVLGAPATVSVVLAGSVSTSPTGVLTALTLAVTDSTDGAAVAIGYNAASGTITGTVAAATGGPGVASFTVNSAGTGTVTYGNGTTGQVANWVVQS